jgi:hypothetical protein
MNPQRLGQLQDFDVGNAPELGFDLGQTFPADVPTDYLAFGREGRLGQPLLVSDPPKLRPDNVHDLSLASFLHRN